MPTNYAHHGSQKQLVASGQVCQGDFFATGHIPTLLKEDHQTLPTKGLASYFETENTSPNDTH